jgi:D-alanine-D-alanine ligase
MTRRAMDFAIVENIDGVESATSAETAEALAGALAGRGAVTRIGISEDKWVEPFRNLSRRTIVVMATHGGIGEGGTLQSYLEARRIRHSHSRAWTCGILQHKHATKLIYEALGLVTPAWQYASANHGMRQDMLCVRKPVCGGGGVGVQTCKPPVRASDRFIHERKIRGTREVSVSVVGHRKVTVLPLVVRKRSGSHGVGSMESAAMIPRSTATYCADAALAVHSALDCFGVTKTDFVLDRDLKPYAIETDAHPGLGRSRSTAAAAHVAGINYSRLIGMILREMVTYGE